MTSRAKRMVQMALDKLAKDTAKKGSIERIASNAIEKGNIEETFNGTKDRGGTITRLTVCEKRDNMHVQSEGSVSECGSESILCQIQGDTKTIPENKEKAGYCEDKLETDNSVTELIEREPQNDNTDSDKSDSEKEMTMFYDSDNSVADKNWLPDKRNDVSVSDSDSSCQDSRRKQRKNNRKDRVHKDINNNEPHVQDRNNSSASQEDNTVDVIPMDDIIPENIDHDEVVEAEYRLETTEKKKVTRAKRGLAKPETWAKNINKKLRMEGKPYIGIGKVNGHKSYSEDRSQRLIGEPSCKQRCKKCRKCEVITDNVRKEIHHVFWNNMNWSEKKAYATALVDQCTPAETKCLTTVQSRRKCTYKYYLRNGILRVPVCKDMFLSTLGIGEHTLYGWMHSLNEHGMPGNIGTQAEKPRKVSPHVEQAREFLRNLPKMPSHYCRASSQREYLEPVYKSFADLYRVYKDYCSSNCITSVSKMTLLNIFRLMNISLFRPKKDQCDVCVAKETNNVLDEDYRLHIERKDCARNEKHTDKQKAMDNNKFKVFTMDVQSVLLSPSIQASAIYFKTKLACHNFTTYNLVSKDVKSYFWHEGESGLTANSFATCIYDLVEDSVEPELEEIILFSDGCGYQNRNATLANTLLHASVKHDVIISQKFLEKGHTQMEVDSVHSTIEQKIRNRPIYSPSNYVEKIREVRPQQPYDVKYLSHEYFKEFSSLQYYDTIRPGKRVGDPVVSDIRELRYLPDGTIQYKLGFNDNHKMLPQTRHARKPSVHDTVGPLYTAPLKIKKSKYDHLQQLKTCIPQDYHAFYDNLLFA